MIIPSKHTGHTRDGVRRVFDSGGSSGPTSTTQTVDLPDWAKGFAKEGVGAASSLVFNRDASGAITGFKPYESYTGERTAQFTPLQQQAFGQAGQQGIAGQIGQATGLAGQAAQGALGAGAGFSPYQTGQFGPQAASYMSPYMQNVVDIQQREAQRAADIAGTQLQGQATRAGAFGGGRQAIVEAEAARNLALQKGDIQAQGLQSAYEQAQRQFNTEQQLGEQSRQYGAGLGLQGYQTALQGAGALGALGQQQFGQQMDITGQQAQFGQQQQQQVQNILSQQYQDFLNQQRAPYEQLEFLGSQVRGLGQTTSLYQAPPSATSQLIGAGTTLAGLAMKAEGGLVQGYASGGITGLLGDDQLAQRQQMPNISVLAKMAAEKEAMDRARMRQGMMAPQGPAPQGTVADEVAAGLAAADIPETMFADGGIVSFQSGGMAPYTMPELQRDPRLAALLAGRQESEAEEEMRLLPAFLESMRSGRTVAQVRQGPMEAPAATYRSEYGLGNEGRRTPMAPLPSGGLASTAVAQSAGPLRKDIPPPPAGKAPPAAPRAAPVGIAQAAQGPMDAAGYMKQVQSLAGADPGEKVTADMDAAAKIQADAIRKAEADTAAEEAKMGPVGVAREKSIAAKEERIAAGEGKNLKNTLIEAGLAIMGGQSPNALSNIAAGAAAGMKGYQARLGKFEAARERVDEDRVKLEELRREAATATGTRKRQVDKEIATLEADRLRAGAAAATALYGRKVDQAKLALDMEREDKKLAQEAQLKREQMRSTENVAYTYAGRSGGGGGAGGGGSKWTELTAQQKAALRAQAARAWDTLEPTEQKKYLKTGGTQDRWIEGRAQYLLEGPAAVNSRAAPTLPAGQWGTMQTQ